MTTTNQTANQRDPELADAIRRMNNAVLHRERAVVTCKRLIAFIQEHTKEGTPGRGAVISDVELVCGE